MHAMHTAKHTHLKTASSALFELALLTSFFLLYCLGNNSRSIASVPQGLFVLYLIAIILGAGAIDAFVAEEKGKSMLAWGLNASMGTIAIIFIATLVFWIWLGYALVIAPIISIPLTAFLMNSGPERN